jgi:uncharacterized cupredoxin-like copper-binding protein
VTVDLQEFSIDASATALITGDVELEVENHGEYPHTLVVSDSDGAVLAATDVLQPSETARLSLDLEPGAYEFTCRIVGTDDAGRVVDHYQAGMHRTVSSA